MNGVAQGVEDGGVVHRNRRVDLPDVRFRDFDELGKAAVHVDADDAHVLADVALAGAALEAAPAGDVHFRRDELARPRRRDLGAHALYHAAELVTEDQRRVDAAL